MKRRITALAVLMALLALTVPVRADVLWEPDNQFYEKHRDECEYIGRNYFVNGQEGYATVWDAPGGSMVVDQFENAAILHVYWQYKDWGCVSIWEENGRTKNGWVPMGDLQLIYDHQSFAEEYADSIRPYDGEFSGYDGDAKTVIFYEYPGATSVTREFSLTSNPEILDNLTGKVDTNSYIQSVFTDEDGRTWGYVQYMYGPVRGWFCLDNPAGTEFPRREVKTGLVIPPQPPQMPAKGYLPYALVGVVVAGTAALLVVFYRKKRKMPGKQA